MKTVHNVGMYDNFRLVFSILWLIATGCLVSTFFLFLFTWGGHLDYLIASAVFWGAATLGTIVTSV